jgi:hypothetical protein
MRSEPHSPSPTLGHLVGNCSSAIDKASDHELEKLYAKFIQFSGLRKREYALNGLQMTKYSAAVYDQPQGGWYQSSNHLKRVMSQGRQLNRAWSGIPAASYTNLWQLEQQAKNDYNNCRFFRILLGMDDKSDLESISQQNKELVEQYHKHQDRKVDCHSESEEMLANMVQSTVDMKRMNGEELSENDKHYLEIQERFRREREDNLRVLACRMISDVIIDDTFCWCE